MAHVKKAYVKKAHVKQAHVKQAHVKQITPITRLLIANRGEIARRIMRTAKNMGIHTVAVYADGDVQAPFVTEADTAIALQGTRPSETYLHIEKLLAACRSSGADAVHPGYGFLSENADFARAVLDAGIAWIGPSPEVIKTLGDKLSAKTLMQAAGVPTLPALPIDDTTPLAAAAKEIGYPVLIKAAAGGGGRGMRVVMNKDALEAAVASAQREASGAFGDARVFMEKWLAGARHVEIQIIGDQHGNLVHCFERECSIQRRHQKIIEEAPSPAVTDALRASMGEAAISAAKKLGYSSAGTIEFLLRGDEFWFLEVNARLQVEHPVTEEIIGHDLVREQLRIAEGEVLSFRQEDLQIQGHAIEARLCAEDPKRDFLPSPGPVIAWQPAEAGQARYDSGVESGSLIAPEFDAMIAKVIVHAPTRREAATRLARALEATRLQGLTTNRDFLVATLRHHAFISADTSTDFIERYGSELDPPELSRAQLIEASMAVVMESQARNRAKARVMSSIPSGWRNTVMPLEIIRFTSPTEDEPIHLEYRRQRDGSFLLRNGDDDTSTRVMPFKCGKGQVDLDIAGRRLAYDIDLDGDTWLIHGAAGDLVLRQLPRYPMPDLEAISGGLLAPMPGAVLSTKIKPGDRVAKGELLLILEAMKMEHPVTAPVDGVIATLDVKVGEQVKNGQLLVTIDEDTVDAVDAVEKDTVDKSTADKVRGNKR